MYVHIPFCVAKCAYCDFASFPNCGHLWGTYVDAVLGELESWRGALRNYELRTIFIGGGTPSILPGEEIARLMDAVRAAVPICSDAEITMEANPGTLSPEKLRVCRAAGINRLSLGAQAMDDGLLKTLGRIHSAAEIREAVSLARQAGFDNVSLDLMYALPGQTIDDWRRTLDEVIALDPEHISAYSLILEEGTPLARRVERGELTVPDDDTAVDMQRLAVSRLAEAGYARYEISNYAKPGRESRHNIVYWKRGEYLGLGCAAHSMMNETRFENSSDLREYLSGARCLNREPLSTEARKEEVLMLATRMCKGMNLDEYEKAFGVRFEKVHAQIIAQLQSHNLVELTPTHLRLTQTGLEVQNSVVVALMDE